MNGNETYFSYLYCNYQIGKWTYLTGSGVLRIGGGVKEAQDDDVEDEVDMLPPTDNDPGGGAYLPLVRPTLSLLL